MLVHRLARHGVCLRSGGVRALCQAPDADRFADLKRELLAGKLAQRIGEGPQDAATITLLGAPLALGQAMPGVERGPRTLRNAGLIKNLVKAGWKVEDKGDLEIGSVSHRDAPLLRTLGRAHNCSAVGTSCHKIAQHVYASRAQCGERDTTIVLGGDRSCAIGSIAGVLAANPNTGIVWVSAHAGLNTPWHTPSGFMHGMPLAFLTRGMVDHTTIPGFSWLGNGKLPLPQGMPALVDPSQVVFVGLREVDEPEIASIISKGFRAFTMHDVDRLGVGAVMDLAVEHLSQNDPNRPLHLMYDIDAMDPVVAPATFTRVAGGLTFREAHFVAETLALTRRLRSMDIVEVNPTLGSMEQVEETVQIAVEVVLSAMGKNILSTTR